MTNSQGTFKGIPWSPTIREAGGLPRESTLLFSPSREQLRLLESKGGSETTESGRAQNNTQAFAFRAHSLLSLTRTGVVEEVQQTPVSIRRGTPEKAPGPFSHLNQFETFGAHPIGVSAESVNRASRLGRTTIRSTTTRTSASDGTDSTLLRFENQAVDPESVKPLFEPVLQLNGFERTPCRREEQQPSPSFIPSMLHNCVGWRRHKGLIGKGTMGTPNAPPDFAPGTSERFQPLTAGCHSDF